MSSFVTIDDKLRATVAKLRESYDTIQRNRKRTIILDHREIVENANKIAFSTKPKSVKSKSKSTNTSGQNIKIVNSMAKNAQPKKSEISTPIQINNRKMDTETENEPPQPKEPQKPKEPKKSKEPKEPKESAAKKVHTHEICKATTMAGNKCKAKALKDGLCGRHMKK